VFIALCSFHRGRISPFSLNAAPSFPPFRDPPPSFSRCFGRFLIGFLNKQQPAASASSLRTSREPLSFAVTLVGAQVFSFVGGWGSQLPRGSVRGLLTRGGDPGITSPPNRPAHPPSPHPPTASCSTCRWGSVFGGVRFSHSFGFCGVFFFLFFFVGGVERLPTSFEEEGNCRLSARVVTSSPLVLILS